LEEILVFLSSLAAIGLSVPRLFFVIKKVKMNASVIKFARRPCALVSVSLSHMNGNDFGIKIRKLN